MARILLHPSDMMPTLLIALALSAPPTGLNSLDVDHDRVAAAGQRLLYLSDDAGRRFREAPYPALPAVRGTLRVQVAGDWLVVYDELVSGSSSAAAASRDNGRTWRSVDLPSCGNAGCQLAVLADGRLDFMTGSEAGCGGGYQTRSLGHVDSRDWIESGWQGDSPFGWFLDAGWVIGLCDTDSGETGCALAHDNTKILFPAPASAPFSQRQAITKTRAVVGQTVFRLARGSAPKKLAHFPAGAQLVGADPSVLIRSGKTVRRLNGTTWKTLFTVPKRVQSLRSAGRRSVVGLDHGKLYRRTF